MVYKQCTTVYDYSTLAMHYQESFSPSPLTPALLRHRPQPATMLYTCHYYHTTYKHQSNLHMHCLSFAAVPSTPARKPPLKHVIWIDVTKKQRDLKLIIYAYAKFFLCMFFVYSLVKSLGSYHTVCRSQSTSNFAFPFQNGDEGKSKKRKMDDNAV